MKVLWSAPYEAFPRNRVYDDLEFLFEEGDCDVWVVDPIREVTSEQIESKPSLKLIVTPSTGTDHLPLAMWKQKPRRKVDYLCLLDDREGLEKITASSEFTFLLILAALRRFHVGYLQLKSKRPRDEHVFRGNELQGKNVGLVGYGRIGRNVARYCLAFGANRVRYYDPYVRLSVKLDDILQQSDIVVICCAFTSETERMIRKEHLEMLPEGAVLVNVARGEVIDQLGFEFVLGKRPDLRVALDVLPGEAIGKHLDNPILDHPHVICTPHMAGITQESQEKAARIVLGLIEQWATNHARIERDGRR